MHPEDVGVLSPCPLPKKDKTSKAAGRSEVQDDAIDDCRDPEDDGDGKSTTEGTEYSDTRLEEDPDSGTRRERKAARKAARNQVRFKPLAEREINRVGEVLHAGDQDEDGSLGFSDPLKSPTIMENMAFNASTFKYSSLRTDIHTKKVQKNNGSANADLNERRQSQDNEIASFIQRLGIEDPDVKRAPKEHRALLAKLYEAIRRDLQCVANETQQHMMRMAGYWRYASRRTYNHMVKQNRIWDWETGAKLEEVDEDEEIEYDDEAPVEAIADIFNNNSACEYGTCL